MERVTYRTKKEAHQIAGSSEYLYKVKGPPKGWRISKHRLNNLITDPSNREIISVKSYKPKNHIRRKAYIRSRAIKDYKFDDKIVQVHILLDVYLQLKKQMLSLQVQIENLLK